LMGDESCTFLLISSPLQYDTDTFGGPRDPRIWWSSCWNNC
jgi:hypothetical protein